MGTGMGMDGPVHSSAVQASTLRLLYSERVTVHSCALVQVGKLLWNLALRDAPPELIGRHPAVFILLLGIEI